MSNFNFQKTFLQIFVVLYLMGREMKCCHGVANISQPIQDCYDISCHFNQSNLKLVVPGGRNNIGRPRPHVL